MILLKATLPVSWSSCRASPTGPLGLAAARGPDRPKEQCGVAPERLGVDECRTRSREVAANSAVKGSRTPPSRRFGLPARTRVGRAVADAERMSKVCRPCTYMGRVGRRPGCWSCSQPAIRSVPPHGEAAELPASVGVAAITRLRARSLGRTGRKQRPAPHLARKHGGAQRAGWQHSPRSRRQGAKGPARPAMPYDRKARERFGGRATLEV